MKFILFILLELFLLTNTYSESYILNRELRKTYDSYRRLNYYVKKDTKYLNYKKNDREKKHITFNLNEKDYIYFSELNLYQDSCIELQMWHCLYLMELDDFETIDSKLSFTLLQDDIIETVNYSQILEDKPSSIEYEPLSESNFSSIYTLRFSNKFDIYKPIDLYISNESKEEVVISFSIRKGDSYYYLDLMGI